MWSLILGASLCLCSMYIGYFVKRHYCARRRFFDDWKDFVAAAKNGIAYCKEPLKNIVDDFAADKGAKSIFPRVVGAVIDRTYQSDAEETDKLKILSKTEKRQLEAFLFGLGKQDFESQLNALSACAKIVDDYAQKAVNEEKSKGALAYKLGILLGIALMIVVA